MIRMTHISQLEHMGLQIKINAFFNPKFVLGPMPGNPHSLKPTMLHILLSFSVTHWSSKVSILVAWLVFRDFDETKIKTIKRYCMQTGIYLEICKYSC